MASKETAPKHNQRSYTISDKLEAVKSGINLELNYSIINMDYA